MFNKIIQFLKKVLCKSESQKMEDKAMLFALEELIKINNNLNKIIEHNIDIKTVIEYSNFENLDYTTQLHLFEYILKISIDSCIQTNTLNKIIIIKSIKSADRVVLKILYSGVISNKKSIISNFEKILLNAYYKLSIKQIDENFISILITFN